MSEEWIDNTDRRRIANGVASRNQTPEEDANWNAVTGGPVIEQWERQRQRMPTAAEVADHNFFGPPVDSPQPQRSTADLIEEWAEGLLTRKKRCTFLHAAYGSRLREFEVNGGEVIAFAAPPAAGKTAFVGQVVFEALLTDDTLKALIANCEMSPFALLDRELARETGIGKPWITHRDYVESARPRLEAGINELRRLAPRLAFMSSPFTTERLAAQADQFGADICVVDYAQRFDSVFRSKDQRSQVNAVMDGCRAIADRGPAVIVVSAVNRTGYTREGANLASFRESSELEYGADSAWLLIPDAKDQGRVALKAVKNRHGALCEIPLLFDGSRQSFTDDTAGQEWDG